MSKNLQFKWKRWLNKVYKLNNFKINRCMKPKHSVGIKQASVDHFCDNSESATGVVSYLKLEDKSF